MKNKRQVISGSIITGLFLFFVAYAFAENILTPATVAKNILEGASITEQIAGFEGRYNGAFANKTVFVDINGLGHRVLLQRKSDYVLLLNNGHASQAMDNRPDENIQANAEAIIAFSRWFEEEKDGNFLYVQVPYKNSKYDVQLPAGIVDYSNDVADRFLRCLDGCVNTLDLRESIKREELDHYALFLPSDHHWNPRGGFFAFTEICAFMAENFGEKIDPTVLNLENYHIELYKNSSMGSFGNKTGSGFVGYDDFELIYPRFETQQICTIPHKQITRSGTFYDAIFETSNFSMPLRERRLYGSYIGGDYPLVIHENKMAQNEDTVVVFIDSFGTPVESFLTTAFQNVIAIDLRWVLRSGMKESAVDFIERYQPDTVIVMFNPNQIGFAESEQFKYGLPND